MLKKNLKVVMAGFLGDHPSHLVAMERHSNVCCFLVTPALFSHSLLKGLRKGLKQCISPSLLEEAPAQSHARGQFRRQKISPTDKEASGTFQLLE